MRPSLYLLIILFCMLWTSTVSLAQTPAFNTTSFAKIPILHEGRIKPMDSFARIHLKLLSGQENIDNMTGLGWLMEVLFDPARAEQREVIKISNPDVLALLELPSSQKLFSHRDAREALTRKQNILNSLLETSEENWTVAQHELIMLQQKTLLLQDLLSSFSLFLPLSVILPEGVPQQFKPYAGKTLNYIEVMKIRQQVDDAMKDIIRNKTDNIGKYTESEQALAFLSFTMAQLQETGSRSTILKIIPEAAGENASHRLSPWQIIMQGEGRPETIGFFKSWQQLAEAYRSADSKLWQNISQKILDQSLTSVSPEKKNALATEILYNEINPLYASFALYLCALAFLFLAQFFPQQRLAALSAVFLSAGFLLHGTAVIARIYILQRPPVGTLYESIIFVGAVTVFFGIIIFLKDRKTLWLYVSTIAGIMLHLLAFSNEGEGDSLLMLTAVLNTNFWLATHVLCITIGYALCIISSLIAHYVLIKTLQEKRPTPTHSIFTKLHTTAILALLFSTAGTILGGIWADQSWGRFWGWDPKENGALLIVLWLIWIIHGRVSGKFGNLLVTAGLAFLSVIVALSWFGVNLLGIGLHSYGFTSGALNLLGAFAIGELLFIGITTGLISRYRSTKQAIS